MDGKVSSILEMVDANTKTLFELKTLLHKLMGSIKLSDIGSPSKSRSVVEHRSGAQVCNVEGLEALLSSSHKNYTEATLKKEI
jgi:hypothetical protein